LLLGPRRPLAPYPLKRPPTRPTPAPHHPLLPPRARLEVCYPLLVEEAAASFTYVWQSQVFPLASCPPRWQQAAQAALRAAGEGAAPGSPGSPRSTPGSPGELRTALPHACGGASSGAAAAASCALPGHGWWQEPSELLPASELITCEWTPPATYHYHRGSGEAEAWLHHDQSVLRTSQEGRWDPGELAAPKARCPLPVLRACTELQGAAAPPGLSTASGLAAGTCSTWACPAASSGYTRPTLCPSWRPAALAAARTTCTASPRTSPDSGRASACWRMAGRWVQAGAGHLGAGCGVLRPACGQQGPAYWQLSHPLLPLPCRGAMCNVQAQQEAAAAAAPAAAAALWPSSCPSTPLPHWQLTAQGAAGQAPAAEPLAPLSFEVHEQQEVPGCGTFTAYRDGRVKVGVGAGSV
jgi:hypothetical protein